MLRKSYFKAIVGRLLEDSYNKAGQILLATKKRALPEKHPQASSPVLAQCQVAVLLGIAKDGHQPHKFNPNDQ